MKSRRLVALRLAGSLLLIGLLVRHLDWSRLALGSAAVFQALALVALLQLLAQGLSAWRWQVVMGSGSLPWSYLFRLYLIGNFFSLFLPTSIGGDAVRIVALSRSSGNAGTAVGSVILERVLGIAALACYLLAGLVISSHRGVWPDGSWTVPQRLGGSGVLVGIVLLCVVVVALLSRWSKAREQFSRALALVLELCRAPTRLARAGLVSLGVQATYIVTWYALARELGIPIPGVMFLTAVPLVSLAAMLPITFAGLGVREGFWVWLLGPFGVSAANAIAFSLVYFVGFVIVGVLGGLWFILRGTDLRTVSAFAAEPPIRRYVS
ncbi:MAG TPA: lysylphosphatidylglycerol synthase transmembrane domain-containing protein [Solirubrobacteraceae bacterium]|nr:lysylphosphatidylglycerol synthase transmembrane domain-containing protein [Solirubrobacteraceae bacterium]